MIEQRILMLLVSGSEEPLTSYELIRLLTRRFNIYNFMDIIHKCLNDNCVEKIDYPSKEMPSYRLTEKGERELKNINFIDFESELLTIYPEQSSFIKLLIRR